MMLLLGRLISLLLLLPRLPVKISFSLLRLLGFLILRSMTRFCRTKPKTTKYAQYASKTNNVSSSDQKLEVAVCGASATHEGSSGLTSAHVLKDFVRETLKEDGNGNWPTSTAEKTGTPQPRTNDNAEAVATDLVALNSDEKTIVAGLLARTIEGGEVVEMCLSLST
ncbi:putative p44-17 outermembrane protein, silent [Anaplasma phagocytophilum str. ApNP]|uniref:Putative p44-17 outermembrane protein, silent n=1 Tax=Anaplasma phagocytophilum str. ApNP TaxID=1359153 RepID=A0A0F3NIX0_ANAPH|nr:putative p44-17 outermembrane protein, silent [Anaplasma phagocytophilum str. ApNP]